MEPYSSEYSEISLKENILILKWKKTTKYLSDDTFKKEALRFKDLVKKYKPLGIIVDMRNFTFLLSPETIQWRKLNIIPVYNEIGLTKFAFVSTDNTINQSSSSNTFETRYFTNISSAQKWFKGPKVLD